MANISLFIVKMERNDKKTPVANLIPKILNFQHLKQKLLV